MFIDSIAPGFSVKDHIQFYTRNSWGHGLILLIWRLDPHVIIKVCDNKGEFHNLYFFLEPTTFHPWRKCECVITYLQYQYESFSLSYQGFLSIHTTSLILGKHPLFLLQSFFRKYFSLSFILLLSFSSFHFRFVSLDDCFIHKLEKISSFQQILFYKLHM